MALPWMRRQIRGRCPVCGAWHATCGGPTTTPPTDLMTEAPMPGPLHEYRVTIRGTETVMLLSDADAATYPGAERIDTAVQDKPAAKMRPTARNKARTSAPNKGGDGGASA